jgi:HEPN domain-containing protein
MNNIYKLVLHHLFNEMAQKEYETWITESRNDFDIGDILLKSQKFNAASFYFVQAAEKAVKAILYYLNQQPWGHSLINLLKEYEDLGKIVDDDLKNKASLLEPHYITSRYPDSIPGKNPSDYYDEDITVELQEAASCIIEFVDKEKDDIDAKNNQP